jgi:2,5-dihydroxypyridine 5,6-dioxygenase
MDERFPELLRVVQQRLSAAGLNADKSLVILCSTENYRPLVDAYYSAAVAMGADPILVTYTSRPPMSSGVPDLVVDMVSQADQVVDLSFKTMAYTDSLTKLRTLLKERGGRKVDGQTYGWEKDLNNIINCPPSEELTQRIKRGQEMIDQAKVIRITSDLGTDFTVERGDLRERPSFTGTIYGHVGFPPPEDTANGTIYFVGTVFIQCPTHQARIVYEPVKMEFERGKLVNIHRDNEVGIMLDDWFRSQNDPNSYQLAHVNLGFDHRIVLHYLDNMAIHYYYGGICMGVGSNWDPLLWGGKVKAKSHIELTLIGADYLLDGKPILIGGEFTADSGLQPAGTGKGLTSGSA